MLTNRLGCFVPVTVFQVALISRKTFFGGDGGHSSAASREVFLRAFHSVEAKKDFLQYPHMLFFYCTMGVLIGFFLKYILE
ncbi:hypothetical protein KC19_1G157800 [Ceratodon purpureus]|uniref:Uncharacterized protein n=1 Tax=Ceratodon purpureus TaxID=3225 RepID=A0A8T0J8K1_CERPU|nr:hypothetical protein KC19_1G157800 [Ceratodon purpureus]